MQGQLTVFRAISFMKSKMHKNTFLVSSIDISINNQSDNESNRFNSENINNLPLYLYQHQIRYFSDFPAFCYFVCRGETKIEKKLK